MASFQTSLRVVMIGASGAVGSALVARLVQLPQLEQLSLLVRKTIAGLSHPTIVQHVVDPLSAASYSHLLAGHDTAVCTLGVGESSKVSHEEFVRIDRDAVIDFGKACKAAGVQQLELLASVDANSKSASKYLRTKGELCDALEAMQFARLSIVAPSMILTPTNRYGLSQAIILKVWPHLNPVLPGGLKKYCGIPVDKLGLAMANNLTLNKKGTERLHWQELMDLSN